MREFTRRNQPHLQGHRTAYQITIILWDAIPQPVLAKLVDGHKERIRDIYESLSTTKEAELAKAHSEHFESLEALLHKQHDQSHLLRPTAIQQLIIAYFLKEDNRLYRLHSITVMSNHVHFLFDLEPQFNREDDAQPKIPLDKIVGRLKGGSAHAVNKALGRSGALWGHAYHDRYIRNADHFDDSTYYILHNAVKAGLANNWEDYPGSG